MADKKTLDVVLEKVGNQPLKTTKVLCGALGLGLATAKAMVDKAPTTVAKGIDHDKALALRDELESLGNTVSIPGMETKTEAHATKNTIATKKSMMKKSAPALLTVTAPYNDAFDAIFGVSTTQRRATTPTKSKDSAKSTPKAKVNKISAAPNDEFDAIFGSNESK